MSTDIKSTFLAPFVSEKPVQGSNVRHAAELALEGLEIPTQKWEEWKYTSLKPVVEQQYIPAPLLAIDALEPYLIPGLEADILVFANGRYQPALSHFVHNAETVTVTPLKELSGEQKAVFEQHFGQVADSGRDIFSALNTAYAEEGVFIHVAKKQIASHPLHILHLTGVESAAVMQTRNLLVLEAQSELKVVESFHSLTEGASFRNAVTEIVVGQNAGGEWVKLQTEGEKAMMVDRTEVRQADDSRYSVFTITLGGEWIRNNLRFHLDGQNTESHLQGLYLLSGDQHVDNFTNVEHLKPHCYSNELYKGVLSDRSNGVFNGKIYVYPDAQKTNAFQSNRNILLSDTASFNTKPQLEIYADDVKCSHGATTGQIDEEAMFYLQARGIPRVEAQKLMTHAFSAEVIQELSMEAVKTFIDEQIWRRFA